MTTSTETVWTALTRFQAELPEVGKSAVNTHFGSNYADLADVARAVIPALAAVGLAWSCQPDLRDDGMLVLRYTLMHGPSDTAISGIYPLVLGTSQQIGSAITYGKRQALLAVTGAAPENEDDDGHAASSARPASAAPVRTKPEELPTDAYDLNSIYTADQALSVYRRAGAAGDLDKLVSTETGIMTFGAWLTDLGTALRAAERAAERTDTEEAPETPDPAPEPASEPEAAPEGEPGA